MAGQAFRAGLIQLTSGRDVGRNLETAADLIREAAAGGAALVLTPEMTNILETDRVRLMACVHEEAGDPAPAFFSRLAAELGIHLLIGSLALKSGADRLVNRSLLFAPNGETVFRYDKIHLFDVDLGQGQSFRESRTYRGGERAVVHDLPWGRFGATICYDLRFPALYRLLSQAGALFISVPSAFTKITGEAHWHVLLRARAIENGAYILAPAQAGRHESGRETFGHSLVVDPWGAVVAERPRDPGVLFATLEPRLAAAARQRIPTLGPDRSWTLAQ